MRLLFVLAGLLGGAVPVVAQPPSDSTIPEPRFEESMIVTAGLEEEDADRLSASVAVIDESEIASRQATNVADLLETVPGLTVLTSGSAGKVTSLFSRGTESDHTLALWNGIELNNPFFGGFDWAFLPTEGVRRIEIVRGPFSSIYGSDAVGGVIQVLTGYTDGGTLRAEAGDNNYQRLAFRAGADGSSGGIEVMGHLRRGDGESENDFFNSSDLALSGRWSPTTSLSVSLLARVNESDIGIPFSGGLPSPEREISWSESQFAVPVAWERGAWELEGQISRVSYTTTFRDPLDAFGFTSSSTDSRAERLRAAASRRYQDSAWLAFGAEIERVTVDDRSVFGVNLEAARQSTNSYFAQLARDVGRARLDVGVRHDDNDVFGSRTTPKIGAVVPLGQRSKLRASWGQGFRAPSVGELFYPFSGTPTLQPEESDSAEIGIDWATQAWELGATAFENDLVNLIDFDFVTFTNRNVGRARTRGVEAWVEFSGRHLAVAAGATVLDSEDLQTGEPLLRRPDQSGFLKMMVRPGDWDVSATATFVGARADIDATTFTRVALPGHTRFEIAGRYEKWRPVQPYARVENLTDLAYQEVAGYPAPGRRLIIGFATMWK